MEMIMKAMNSFYTRVSMLWSLGSRRMMREYILVLRIYLLCDRISSEKPTADDGGECNITKSDFWFFIFYILFF